jgi:hypothetical protein
LSAPATTAGRTVEVELMGARALLVSGLLAAGLTMSMAGIVIAGPDSEIRIEDPTGNEPVVGGTITVCEFHLAAVAGSDDHETGTWEIRDAGGGTVLSGDYETFAGQPDRIPDTGEFTLAAGSYVLLWDSESIDRSHREKAFDVECGAGVAPTASPSPTPTPPGAVLPTTGANPGGGAPDVTLPPTDAGFDATGTQDNGTVWSIALVLSAIALIVFLATPRVTRRPRTIRVRNKFDS